MFCKLSGEEKEEKEVAIGSAGGWWVEAGLERGEAATASSQLQISGCHLNSTKRKEHLEQRSHKRT